jgi:ribosome maturation factor RimP
MAEILEKLSAVLVPILDQHGAFLVEMVIHSERGGKLVQAFVDTDKGITIEECALVSRELAHELDLIDLFHGSYRLEVSSPGIDKPVRLLRQYAKNVGRRYTILHQAAEARATLVGKLVSIEGDRLTFESETGECTTLEFTKIIESKEELPW